jgi:hypothetical protein
MEYIPVSIGELLDKYTILQIKKEKMYDTYKKSQVINEINMLQLFVDNYLNDIHIIKLYNELLDINKLLWNIEDSIRHKEQIKEFDIEFINLSRNVYKTNDNRSQKKLEINKYTNSTIIEVKEYIKY